MPATHCGINNPQREQRHRWIMLGEFRAFQPLSVGRLKCCPFFRNYRADRFLNNQRNQWFGCVIGPGTMAGLIVGSRLDAAGLKIWLHAIFEDGFID